MSKPQSSKATAPWDRIDPKTPNGKFALDVLRSAIGDEWHSLSPGQQTKIEKALPAFETHHHRGKQANRLEYNHWIDRISRSMMSGDRIEILLINFLEDLQRLVVNDKSDALFALLLEEITDGTGRKTMQLLRYTGRSIHDRHWQNFKKTVHVTGSSEFFRNCLDQNQDLEVILARYVNHYHGELDSLVSASLEQDASISAENILDRFWLSNLALPSEHVANRCLLVAYENAGDDIRPHPPQGASEEWRVLYFLRTAYNQINYRIRDLPNYIQAQRQSWIRELAPSVLAHEAVAQTQIIADSALQSAESMLTLMDDQPTMEPHLTGVTTLIENMLDTASNLNRTFATYLNLQRKSRVEQFVLQQVFAEAWELCKYRLHGIEVAMAKPAAEQVLQTDRVLLTLVLTNLLTNAARAINEGKWPSDIQANRNKILLTIGEKSATHVQLVLANSGPPIPPEQSGRIFERGFSTYADGHGQGLFVCRLICQHMGGELNLITAQPFGSDYQVAFSITIVPRLKELTEES